MKTLQRLNNEHISNRLRALLTSLPIIVGATIFLSSEIAFWMSRTRMPRGGFTTIVLSILLGGIAQIIPFVIISQIVRSLIIKGVTKSEVYLKLAFMIVPVSIITAYWLFKYIDPFALGFLIFINIFILIIGFLAGVVVCSIIRRIEVNN